jgi:hypothetical protein
LADSCTLVVVRVEAGKIRVAEIVERRPARGQPLKPTVVLGELLDIAREHGCAAIWTDQAAKASVFEVAAPRHMAVMCPHGGNEGKVKAHTLARDALNDGRCEWSTQHKILPAQLREVLARKGEGASIFFSQPRRAGRHGDVASAWILATSVAAGWQGSVERERQRREEGDLGVYAFGPQGGDKSAQVRIARDREALRARDGDTPGPISDLEVHGEFWRNKGAVHSLDEIRKRGLASKSDMPVSAEERERWNVPDWHHHAGDPPGVVRTEGGAPYMLSSYAQHRSGPPLINKLPSRVGTPDHPIGCGCEKCTDVDEPRPPLAADPIPTRGTVDKLPRKVGTLEHPIGCPCPECRDGYLGE